MPFTLAHPAIVLPLLNRRRLSATALIVGSIVPDFEYFFKMKVNSVHSHTVGGLFYFDLPVAFLLGWLFLRFVRPNLMANVPLFLQRRFQPVAGLTVRGVLIDNAFVYGYSALLGAASHLFWDGFTHNNTFFVRNLSFYHGAYVPYGGVRYPLWYALQHISSAVGLIIMLAYALSRRPREGNLTKPAPGYWVVVGLITAAVVALRFQLWPDDLKEGNVIVSVISGFCIALVLAGMINFRNITLETNRHDG